MKNLPALVMAVTSAAFIGLVWAPLSGSLSTNNGPAASPTRAPRSKKLRRKGKGKDQADLQAMPAVAVASASAAEIDALLDQVSDLGVES